MKTMNLDTIKVTAAGIFGIGFTLQDIDVMVKICVGIATLGYIIYKWYKETKK